MWAHSKEHDRQSVHFRPLLFWWCHIVVTIWNLRSEKNLALELTDRATLHCWLKQAKGLISGPSAKRTKDLLKLNRDQLRWVVGLFTGHYHLKGHLFKLGLTDDPICERCLEEDESATHILCDCEAIAYLRFRHLGQFFMEPSDYYDAPINKVVHFIRGVGLIKG
jgi:hypothetical protein